MINEANVTILGMPPLAYLPGRNQYAPITKQPGHYHSPAHAIKHVEAGSLRQGNSRLSHRFSLIAHLFGIAATLRISSAAYALIMTNGECEIAD